MSVSKGPVRGTYYVQCWYKVEGTPDMTLNAFYDLYCRDMEKKCATPPRSTRRT